MSTSSHSLCIDNHSIVYSACEQIRANWEDLATRLSVPRPSVEAIRADGKDSADCLRKLLDEWLKRSAPEQPLPSWRGLCDALTHLDRSLSERISDQHQCGCSLCTGCDGEAPIGLVSPLYNEIYQKLKNPVGVAEYMYSKRALSLLQLEKIQDSPGNEKEVLLTSLESAVSLNQYNLRVFGKALKKEEATYSLGKSVLVNCRKEEFPTQSKIKEIIVERKYKKEFQSMRTALGQLCASAVNLLRQKRVSVSDLRNKLKFSFPEMASDLKECSSLNEVVSDVIRPRVSLVQIDYLEAVFDLFKLGKRAIKKYKRKVDELYETVEIEYGQLLMDEFDSSNTSELESIEFVLDWDENECLLKDIRDLFHKIVRNYSSRVKVIVIYKGNSIVVKCCVPAYLLPVITRMIQDSEAILNREKVISVIAEGRTIFKRIVIVEQETEFEVSPKKEIKYEDFDKFPDDPVAHSPRDEQETSVHMDPQDGKKEIRLKFHQKRKLELYSKLPEGPHSELGGDTALIRASANGHYEGVKLLLSAQASVNQRSWGDCTALMESSANGHSDVVQLLILAGARLEEKDFRFGETALMKASAGGHSDVVQLLISAGARLDEKDDGDSTALMKASVGGHSNVVQLLILAGARLEEKDFWFGETALMKASASGHSDVVQLLISAGSRLDEKDDEGCTTLMKASAGGRSDVVKSLISAGASLDKKDDWFGETALMKASACGHSDVVQLLISAGSRLDVKDDEGYTALMKASAGGHSDVVQFLISAGASLDEKDNGDCTALMESSANGHSDVVQLLISAGARLEENDFWPGETALMKASAGGHSDVVQLLISAGASLDEKDDEGYTALMKASAGGHSDVVELLISAGARLDAKNRWPGETALMKASASGHFDVVQLLLSAGARLNEKDDEGYTALMKVSTSGHSAVVQLLISSGASLDEQDDYGHSPIMIAKVLGHHDLIELFVSTGLVSKSELVQYSLPEGWRAKLNYDGKIYYYKTSDPHIFHENHPLFEDV